MKAIKNADEFIFEPNDPYIVEKQRKLDQNLESPIHYFRKEKSHSNQQKLNSFSSAKNACRELLVVFQRA